MDAIVPETIERYARNASVDEPALLTELRAETEAEAGDLARMLVGPLEGSLLRLLCRLLGAQRVLEIGTFTGYSALWLADGVPANGRVVTLDRSEEWTDLARTYWDRSPVGDRIRLVLGDARTTLPQQEGPFDLVFLDADKENYATYWDTVLPMIRPGGLIVADNVLWNGEVLDPEDDLAIALARFNEKVHKDERVEAILLPVRDGITLAWKR